MTLSNQPILVFDLDDTLFSELSYVRSGLKHVAAFAAPKLDIPEAKLNEAFLAALETGRSHIFNRGFEALGLDVTKTFIKACVRQYRTHQPDIQLKPEAEDCLERFADYRKFIVTDGNQTAQNNKIEALGLRAHVEHAFITYRYGHKHQKPSPYCFNLIAKRTNKSPQVIVYIADNPDKDFVGIKPLGFRTIRVHTGQHSHKQPAPSHKAHISITSLDELTDCLLDELMAGTL